MPRADLQKTEADTDHWYLIPQFKTKADAEEALKLLSGLTENRLQVYERKVMRYGLTIVGQTIMEVFKVPGRSYDVEDMQALLQERHFAPSNTSSYLPHLVREGLLKKLGPKTYYRPHDPAPALRTDDNVAPSGDGQLAGLEPGQACGCGCGDEG